MQTAFTQLVGCTVPVQLAAMPGIATPALAAAVSDAGGLGMIGAPMLPPELLSQALAALRAQTRGTFGVNFLMPFLGDRAVVAIAAAGARLVEFFYGDPDAALVEMV